MASRGVVGIGTGIGVFLLLLAAVRVGILRDLLGVSFLVLTAGTLFAAVTGIRTRRASLAWAGAGGLVGLGWLSIFSIGMFLLPAGLALCVAAATVRDRESGRRNDARALAAGALALALLPGFHLVVGAVDAAADPCVDLVWKNEAGPVGGSSVITPDDPCRRGGTRYTSVYEVAGVGLLAPAAAAGALLTAERQAMAGAIAATLALALVGALGFFGIGHNGTVLAGPPLLAAVLAAAAALSLSRDRNVPVHV